MLWDDWELGGDGGVGWGDIGSVTGESVCNALVKRWGDSMGDAVCVAVEVVVMEWVLLWCG